MLKTVGGKRADFSGHEPGINVPAPRMLKNKQFSPSVQFIFSACLIKSSIIILFSTFVRASGHRFTCPVISRKLRIVRSSQMISVPVIFLSLYSFSRNFS